VSNIRRSSLTSFFCSDIPTLVVTVKQQTIYAWHSPHASNASHATHAMSLRYRAFTHALHWDWVGWAALITQYVNTSLEIHRVTSAAHPTPIQAQRVCECTIRLYTSISAAIRALWTGASHFITSICYVIEFCSKATTKRNNKV